MLLGKAHCKSRSSKVKWLLGPCLFVVAFVIYIRTLCPTVALVDSGELILACTTLGVAHPPGFPLYTLLGYLFSSLPFGEIAYRVNLMSAFWGALSAWLLFCVASRSLSRLGGEDGFRAPLCALIAGLSWAFSATVWSWSTVAEVYTLGIFIVALLILLVLGGRSPRSLVLVAFLVGLSFSNHVFMTLSVVPAVLYWMLSAYRKDLCRPRICGLAVAAFLLGASLYLYLPIRAAQEPLLNWGNPINLRRLLWHISGKQYRVNLLSSSWLEVGVELRFFIGLWWKEFTPAGLILVLLGAGRLFLKGRRLFILTCMIAVANIAIAVSYTIAEDKAAYYLPLFLISALWLAVGMRWLLGLAAAWSRSAGIVVAGLLFLIPAVELKSHYFQNDRSSDYIARRYAENTLDCLEENALLLTREWQLYSPALYLQHVEGLRPDVAILDTELLRRTWYIDYLRKQYPDISEASGRAIDSYAEQLYLFEYGLPYEAAVIQEKYVAMLNSFIDGSAGWRPAYLGLRYRTPDMQPGIATQYAWIPEGLSYRLYQSGTPSPRGLPDMDLKGLIDGGTFLDYVVKGKVMPHYVVMLSARARYLRASGAAAEAEALMKTARALQARIKDE